jgi:hypothetical protein
MKTLEFLEQKPRNLAFAILSRERDGNHALTNVNLW